MDFEKLYDPMKEEPLKDLNIQITAQSKDSKGNIRRVIKFSLELLENLKTEDDVWVSVGLVRSKEGYEAISFQFLDPTELKDRKLVELKRYYKSKIRGSGRNMEITKILTHVGFSLSGIYTSCQKKIENSGKSDPLYKFPIDELIPGENHSSFKYSVEDKSLVIDKFESEKTLYIGNFPDGHIQKRQRENTSNLSDTNYEDKRDNLYVGIWNKMVRKDEFQTKRELKDHLDMIGGSSYREYQNACKGFIIGNYGNDREWKQIVEDESVDEIMERIDPDEMMSFIKMTYQNNS